MSESTAPGTVGVSDDKPILEMVMSAEEWKDIFGIMASIEKECFMESTEEGVKFKVMDGAHLALARVYVPASACMHYEKRKEGNMKKAVSLEVMEKALNTIKDKSSSVLLEMFDNNIVKMSMFGLANGNNFRLRALLDTGSVMADIQNEEALFDTEVTLDSEVFLNVMKDIEALPDKGEYASFAVPEAGRKLLLVNASAVDNVQTYSATLEDNDKITVELGKVGENFLSKTLHDKSMWNVKWLKKFVENVDPKKKEKVKVKFGYHKPLKIELEEKNGVTKWFYLAPRVADDGK